MNRALPSPELGKMIGTIAIIALSLTGVIWLQKNSLEPPKETLTATEYEKKEQPRKTTIRCLQRFTQFRL
jgi:hypothetical protein